MRFWDQEEQKWTMLMWNVTQEGYAQKWNLEDFYVFFFLVISYFFRFFFFLNPQFSNPFTENVFLWRRCSGRFPLHFCFSFFFLLPSVDVDFVAQSLASGTVEEEEEEEWEEQMLSSLIIIALLGKKYGKNDDGGSFKFWN